MTATTSGPPTTMTTATDALQDEEVVRTRTFLRLGWVFAACFALAILALPGDVRLGRILIGVIAATAIGAAWMERRVRITGRVDARPLNVLAFLAIACGELGILYTGIFSAAAVIVALFVFVFCRTEHRASAIGVFVLAAGAHAAIAGAVIGGLIDDPGFYPIRRDAAIEAQIAAIVTMEQLYGLCFFLARLTRKTSLAAIEQLQKATRLAAVRDAQVAELRMDLDRALKIGGPGRFTGHVVGAWELGAVLGRGAMGEVYEARHTKTTAETAVKLLRRDMLADPTHVERFFREVKIASSIDSPHVVRILDSSTPTDTLPYLAMERLRGKTLGEVLRAGPLPRARMLGLVQQLGGVLELARTAGIVHRDLKPHNIFLADASPTDVGRAAPPTAVRSSIDEGLWKVLDFGVALLGDSSGTLTQGGVIGTPAYMAPEQAKGAPVDHRADAYAFGAVIYRSLTGRVPFVARDTPALLYAVVHIMPLRPSAFVAMEPDVMAFLAIALAKAKEARFATALELAQAYSDAERGALSPALRAKARGLVQSHPWAEPEKKA